MAYSRHGKQGSWNIPFFPIELPPYDGAKYEALEYGVTRKKLQSDAAPEILV